MLLILFLLPAVLGINVNPRKLTGKQLVDYVNRNAKWRVRSKEFGDCKRRFQATTRRIDTNATNLLAGVKLDFPRVFASDQRQKPRIFVKKIQRNIRLPRSFDARRGWSYCADQIDKIQDQRYQSRRTFLCGSCWAVSSASSLQDRFCIWSRGSIQPDLSAIDLVSCCTECGEGCTGGYPHRVFEYAEKQGIVSGGNFTNSNGCKPYPFANCQNGHGDFSGPQCKGGNKEDVCIRTCQPAFSYNYYTDRYFTSGSVVIQNDATAIQQELFRSGPLVFGAMQIFEDFLHYRSGVYEVTAGKFIGLHAVRLVGYGVENNVPYWLVANSWGRNWGQNGYFKIRRGQNEANIEGISSAGFPDFRRSSPAFDHL
ncbi:Secreted C13 protease-like protein [Aphelenchoides besseyi]|nr:Secreted C13 protease-like protein [Aphelenchoides besseyi]